MGILDPAGKVTSGRALFGGADLLALSERDLAEQRGRELSMIFQNPRTALNPIRKVGQQIADVLVRHGGATRAQAPKLAIEMLKKVRISDPERRAKAYPFELSGGMPAKSRRSASWLTMFKWGRRLKPPLSDNATNCHHDEKG